MAHNSLALPPHHFLRAQGYPARTDLVNPRVGQAFALPNMLSYTSCIPIIFVNRLLRLCVILLGFFFLPSSLSLFSTIRAVHYPSLLVQIILIFFFLISCQLDYWYNPLFLYFINYFSGLLCHSHQRNLELFSITLSL